MFLFKKLKCLRDMQRTWWRTVATLHMWLRVFVCGLCWGINQGAPWPQTLLPMAPCFHLLYWYVYIRQDFYAKRSKFIKKTNLISVTKEVLNGYARVRLYVGVPLVRWVFIKRIARPSHESPAILFCTPELRWTPLSWGMVGCCKINSILANSQAQTRSLQGFP